MQQQPKRKQTFSNWLGVVIFLLVAVGPTIWRIISSIFAGAGFSLPAGVPVPALIIGAIVVAVMISGAINVVRRAQRSETSLPTSLPTSMPAPLPTAPPKPASLPTARNTTAQRTPNAPMPPFGGEFGPFFPTLPTTSDIPAQSSSNAPQLPRPPGFEPIISGKAILASMALFSAFGLAYLLAIAVLP